MLQPPGHVRSLLLWTLSKPPLFFLEQGLKMDEVLQLQPRQYFTEAESVFPYPAACVPPAVAQLCSFPHFMEVHFLLPRL